jgi:hypothetical protein
MDEKTVYKNWRVNILAAAAFVVVILCLVMVVLLTITDEFAKGIITIILGRFLGYVDNVYAFEFGTTRGSKAKDDAISNMAAASPLAPSVVSERVVAAASPKAEVPVVTPGPENPDGVVPAADVVDKPPKGEVK